MSFSVENTLEKNKLLLQHVSHEIWKHPELCFEEKFAHDLLTDTLENFGFTVQRHYFLFTAFRAEFDSGKDGPTIAAICEYDALPGIGHACGHNLIAEIGLGVGMAVKQAMEVDSTIGGKIVVLGTPAEEGGGGKVKLIHRGAFNDIDAVMMAHPQSVNRLYPLIVECAEIVVLGTPAEEGGGGKVKLIHRGAFNDIDAVMMAHPQSVNRLYPLIVECAEMSVTFNAHSDDFWHGPSAVDAAIVCYNNISLMRRTLSEKLRISMIIPSSSSEESTMKFLYRAPTHGELEKLKEKLELLIKISAQATNCDFSIISVNNDLAYRGLLYNKTMTEVFGKHANSMGVTFYDNDPKLTESAVSSDVGNVSHVVPAIQPEFAIGAHHPHVNHTPGFADVARSEKAQEFTLVITKALAKTAIDLMSNLDLMGKVKDEFENNPLKEPILHKVETGE